MKFIANHTNQDQNQNRNCGQHQNGGPMNVQCLLWKMLDANTRKTIIDVQNLGTGGNDKQPQDINKQPQDNKTTRLFPFKLVPRTKHLMLWAFLGDARTQRTE
jgi:hypothetical protein